MQRLPASKMSDASKPAVHRLFFVQSAPSFSGIAALPEGSRRPGG
nr:hypothetical protein SHINE37_120314 [Rhizobiaceae bacterium]